MSSTYGDIIKLSIFGQSHGAAIGMTLDGVPVLNLIREIPLSVEKPTILVVLPPMSIPIVTKEKSPFV